MFRFGREDRLLGAGVPDLVVVLPAVRVRRLDHSVDVALEVVGLEEAVDAVGVALKITTNSLEPFHKEATLTLLIWKVISKGELFGKSIQLFIRLL